MQKDFAKYFAKPTNKMTKKERLEEVIRHFGGGKPSLFAKKLGIAPSTISSWLARDTFDYDLIFANCEGISAKWLITGEGHMLHQDQTSTEIQLSAIGIEDKLLNIIQEKDSIIRSQAEEIGQLCERINQLERVKNASTAHTEHTANVG